MGHTRIENVWVCYEDLEGELDVIKHKLPNSRFVSPVCVGDFIVFGEEEIGGVWVVYLIHMTGPTVFRFLKFITDGIRAVNSARMM